MRSSRDANCNRFAVDDFIEVEISSRKNEEERKITELRNKLKPGDRLVVTEVSRLGRAPEDLYQLIPGLVKSGVTIESIKEHLVFRMDPATGDMDLMTEVLMNFLGIMYKMERSMISSRTKAALAAKKAQGVVLGKPKGRVQERPLDKHKATIFELLQKNIPKSSIARIVGTSRQNLNDYIKKRFSIINDSKGKRAKERMVKVRAGKTVATERS